MKWHTPPLQVVLARGTPGELVLDVPGGFTVVEGDAAADMYDIILGRQLLAKVSGFVMPFMRQFYYMPGLQKKDTTMHSLPIMVGYKRAPSCGAVDAAAFDVPRSFWACACLQEDQGPNAQQTIPEQQKGFASAAGACSQAGEGEAAAAPVLKPACASSRHSDMSLLLLLLWPVLWLFGAVDSFCELVAHERPFHAKQFYRLGRFHRAADGETIRLRLAPGSSGNKPKVLALHRRHVTWQFALTTLFSRAMLLLLLTLVIGATRSMAMHVANHSPLSVSLSANPMQVLPLPSNTHAQVLLVVRLSEVIGGTFRCFRLNM
jgi:hypothetical protein